jgi:hypothetical protein
MRVKGRVGQWLGFAVVALTVLGPAIARAGSPHFVSVTVERDGNTLIADGKEAGLGSETQVHIVLSADAACINPGDNHPKADNKESFSAEGDFPVQNGKALFYLELTPTFQPDCTPPMTVVFTNVKVCDEEHNVCLRISGTY